MMPATSSPPPSTSHPTIRVLHVLPHRGGGAETYIDMLERLPGHVHERFALSSGREPRSALASIPARWPRLAARIRGADLVHCHGDVASAIALPLLRVRPAVVTSHGLHMVRRLDGVPRKAVERTLAAVAARCQSVICTSSEEQAELAGMVSPQDREKLRVIYNGVDPPPAVSESERAEVRAELGVPPETVLGLFVGRLEQRKRPLLAARAAIEAHAQTPFVLLVVGDGPQASELQPLAGQAVRLLGHRRDVARLMGAADVFLQPSEREGMALALLEAMSWGLTVVAADSSSNPEVVADAGLLFRSEDQAALAQAVATVTSDAELRASLGARATARARDEFSASAFLEHTAAIYERAAGRATGPAPPYAAPGA